MQIKSLINPQHDLSNPDLNLSNFSDKDLYHLCQRYGNGIKILRRVFAVLLVEVNRRKLHRKYGFEGIYEFAAKVGGMNRQLVNRILWLAEALKDKPYLWREFKKEGWSKVRVVASVATIETDKLWAEKVSVLSKPALEVLVKDWREKNMLKNEHEKFRDRNGNENLFDFANKVNDEEERQAAGGNLFNFVNAAPENVLVSVPKNSSENLNMLSNKLLNTVGLNFGDTLVRMRLKVTQETEFKFLLFKQQLCKKKKEALTSGEVLKVLLDGVEFKRI